MNDFNEKELRNIVSIFDVRFSVKKVYIKPNAIGILQNKFPEEDYSKFPIKYLCNECYVFQDGNDYFILEDNNYVIVEDCFEELVK